MELVVIGSGTAVPHPARSPSGLLVRSHSRDVLVDAGPGTLHRLAGIGVEFQEIQDVFLTHLHIDHVLDVVSLLFAKRNPDVVNAPTLTIRGGPGLRRLLSELRALFDPWLEPRGYALFVEEYSGPVLLEGLRVRACPVDHHASSLAYRFESRDGKSLVISGDTGEDERLVEIGCDADLMVLECSFPDGQGLPGHLTPSSAGGIARKARARRLLLTHFYPACDGKAIVEPCREAFGGEVFLARDGLKMPIA